LLIFFEACTCDIYKGLHDATWQESLISPKSFYLAYIEKPPVFSDTLPFHFCPDGFKNYLNFGNYKWVRLQVKLIEVSGNKPRRDELLRSRLAINAKNDSKVSYPLKKITIAIYPYCSNHEKWKITNYYESKSLVYFAGGTEIENDSMQNRTLFTETILRPEIEFIKELYPLPIQR
jgi:hypothetical protein